MPKILYFTEKISYSFERMRMMTIRISKCASKYMGWETEIKKSMTLCYKSGACYIPGYCCQNKIMMAVVEVFNQEDMVEKVLDEEAIDEEENPIDILSI